MFEFLKRKNKKEKRETCETKQVQQNTLGKIDPMVLEFLLREKKLLVPSVIKCGGMENVSVNLKSNCYAIAANSIEAVELLCKIINNGQAKDLKLTYNYPPISEFAMQTLELPYVANLLKEKSVYYDGLAVYIVEDDSCGMAIISYDELMEIIKRG